MSNRKESRKYFFSVEGETEAWYLENLRNLINTCGNNKFQVSFNCKVEKDPVKIVKGMSIVDKVEITHLMDYESNEEIHTRQFQTLLDRLEKAKKIKCKNAVTYNLGYTNFTFELWIILHKEAHNRPMNNRSQYIGAINRLYGETFENLGQYKHENNFKRVLKQITIDDVKAAIARAEQIMLNNINNGCTLHEYKKYNYYKENPSLLIHEAINKILKDCGLK